MFAALPPLLRWLIWLLVVVILLILMALIVHALGGFDWSLRVGHFHLRLGVS